MHHHPVPKMSRMIVAHLVLVWLLLVASHRHFSAHVEVQAIEIAVVNDKLKPAQPSSTWVGQKRKYKNPSGPNPVGNHNPPSKL